MPGPAALQKAVQGKKVRWKPDVPQLDTTMPYLNCRQPEDLLQAGCC